MPNENLTKAKSAKNDEFYTQISDIFREVNAYLEYDPDAFRGKTILCPCDDPYESNFFKYFALKFNSFGLKRLIATCYAGSPIANVQLSLFDHEPVENKTTKSPHKIVVNEGIDENNDGVYDLDDLITSLSKSEKNTLTRLKGDGDFRSAECTALLHEADIIITNPPFSKFREFINWITKADKQFLIIGNINAITYKEVFPLIKNNKIWLGATNFNTGMYFMVPDDFEYAETYKFEREQNGYKVNRVPGVCWFTNLDHGRRHEPLPLMSAADNLRYSRHKEIRGRQCYDRYDNYDAIDVPFTDALPSDYKGVMGVPITFLDKYCPEQFEIIGTSDNGLIDDKYKLTQGLTQKFVDDYYKSGGKGSYKEGNPTAGLYIDGIATMVYKRLFIKHKE
jgi:hypothetical protein